MVRNPFSNLKCMTLEEKRKYVQDIHLKFPEIKEEVLPDYLVEKYHDCKQAFLEYYWELSRKLEKQQE